MFRLFSIKLLLLLGNIFSGGSTPLMEKSSLGPVLVVKCKTPQSPQDPAPDRQGQADDEFLKDSPIGRMVLNLL